MFLNVHDFWKSSSVSRIPRLPPLATLQWLWSGTKLAKMGQGEAEQNRHSVHTCTAFCTALYNYTAPGHSHRYTEEIIKLLPKATETPILETL